MWAAFTPLVEERIRQAQAKGAFDDLPGTGKPLVFDDDPLAPEALRVAWRLLVGAGLVGAGTGHEGPMPATFAAMMALVDRRERRGDPYDPRARLATARAREAFDRRVRAAAATMAARERKETGR